MAKVKGTKKIKKGTRRASSKAVRLGGRRGGNKTDFMLALTARRTTGINWNNWTQRNAAGGGNRTIPRRP